MDHVQLPAGGFDHIQVPYVAAQVYDSEDFGTYPCRVGFPEPGDHAAWQEIDAAQTASLVQSWLYFGLMTAFLNRDLDLAEFVLEKTPLEKDGPNRRFVSSLALIHLLDDWSATAGDSAFEEERLKSLVKISAAARSHFSSLPQADLSPLPEILLSVNTLITTLAEAAFGGDPDVVSGLSLRPHTSTFTPDPAAKLLTQELLNAGWCSFKIQQIMSDYSYMAIYYISRLRDAMAPHISHAACTIDRCVGNNVDMANYATRHAKPSCKCSHSPVPEEKMRSIIANGGIPIVAVKISRGHVYLEVKKATHRSRYIAISHVWSDGLGNPHANSLPECQLRHLARSFKLLMPPMFDFAQGYISIPQLNVSFDAKNMAMSWGSTRWFWLDTLCIPVGADDESMLLKSKAINQMAAIYAGAHQVLVLDSVMQAFSVAGRDACHVFAQMSALAWLGRCWTYQEGALAWALQVQCADCSFDPAMLDYDPEVSNEDMYLLLPGTTTSKSSWYRARHALSLGVRMGIDAVSEPVRDIIGLPVSRSPRIRDLLFKHVYNQLREVVGREMCDQRRQSFSLTGDTMRDFVLCWNSLARRTTTMAGDIHVILANLLRLNAFSILAMTGHEDRMRAILWSLPGIPLFLFFNPSKERVRPTEHHGNRWMPLWPDRHTLEASPVLEINDDALVLVSPADGDDAQARILLLDGVYRGSSTELLVSDTSGPELIWYHVVLYRQPDDEFDSSSFQATAFILEPKGRDELASLREIRAACLHISNTEAQPDYVSRESQQPDTATTELKLRATFDCPATARFLGSARPPIYPNLPCHEAESIVHYTLSIQHDVPTTQSPLPQRPQRTPFLGVSLALMMICGPFNILLCAMTALLVYQHVTQHATFPSSVLIASYLAIVTHSYTFLVALYMVPVVGLIPAVFAGLNWNLVPFVIGLVYVGLKAAGGGVGRFDKAVLGLLFCGHVPQIVMVAVARWYVNVRIYKAWLETYEPEWSPAVTDPLLKGVLGTMEGAMRLIR